MKWAMSLLVVALATAATVALAQPAGKASTELTVKGSVEREITFSVDDLKALPVQRADDARPSREGASSGGDATRHYVGCLLRDVLNRARPKETAPRSFRKSAVIATASDGYRVVFSWAELYISPVGDGVLVVYERDGKPLGDDQGRIALVSLKDTQPGPRHVKWLQSVELRTLAE
jgi:DMSO/TMAO reductase YedYZ molybdopterin-dependent catalytic subunit